MGDIIPQSDAVDQLGPQTSRSLFRRWRDARVSAWDVEARDAIDFVLGNHYTQAESDTLKSIGQADFIIDRVYAAIDKLTALLTSKEPKYTAIGREDSDNKLAMVWRVILEYIWDISDGSRMFRQAVFDYATPGLGYFYAYIDPDADEGRGEVKFTYVNPFRVYVDPFAADRYFQDASAILLSTILTKDQLLNLYPQLHGVIDDLETMSNEEDYPSSSRKNTSQTYTPDTIKGIDSEQGDRYRILDRFTKVKVPFYRLFNKSTGEEKVVNEEQYSKILEENSHLFESGLIEAVQFLQTRVKMISSVGDHLLYETILNTDIYPVIPVPNIWMNTPYPKSDVTKVKDLQRLLNKLFSLILSHAQTSAGLKLLIPEGSVDDVGQVERDWANPNAVIEYNPDFGEPHFPSPQPLSSEFYHIIDKVEHYIDLSFGIPELMQGFKDQAPDTVRGTAMLAEMGESRGKSKLRDIEGSLMLLGKCLYQLAKGHYTFKKTFRIVQPNNDLTEFTVNNRLYDDKTNELIEIENDISIGQLDIRIVSGSTLPSNKMLEYQMYLEAYKLNLIDDVEVLKKTEIYDKEGVLKRKSMMAQMQRYIQELEQKVKELRGDLQTSERESLHAQKRVATEKWKSRLDEVLNDIKLKERTDLLKLKNAVDKRSQIVSEPSKAQKGDQKGR